MIASHYYDIICNRAPDWRDKNGRANDGPFPSRKLFRRWPRLLRSRIFLADTPFMPSACGTVASSIAHAAAMDAPLAATMSDDTPPVRPRALEVASSRRQGQYGSLAFRFRRLLYS